MSDRTRPADPALPAGEMEAILAAYAARRLEPRLGSLPRIRAALFERLDARAAGRDRAGSWRARLGRRLVVVGLAASLILGAAATVAAAGPASPFYGARLWIESVTLPAAADDRAAAHLARLQARLADAEAAAASGNGSAVAQALAAYRAEVEAALADVGDDAEQLARLEAALSTNLVVLSVLAEHVPPQAADAIQNAAGASHRAVDKIKEKNGKPTPANPSNRPDRD